MLKYTNNIGKLLEKNGTGTILTLPTTEIVEALFEQHIKLDV